MWRHTQVCVNRTQACVNRTQARGQVSAAVGEMAALAAALETHERITQQVLTRLGIGHSRSHSRLSGPPAAG
jgi:hypothetical protein